MSQNKKFRKFAAASLAATATVVAVAPAVAAAQFDDVTENNVHADNISKLVEAGVITGYPNGEFRPAESIQRRHVAVMLFRQFELEAPADVEAVLADYTDVSADDIYADEIAAVIEAGFFKGSNGEFMPTENFSREQMATVLVRAFALVDSGEDVDVYLDNVDPSHQVNVKILAQHGLTTELDDFRPKEDVERGQFATFTVRTVEATAAPAAPAVESVSAINATQVEVDFSVAVDKTDAEIATHYAIDDVNPQTVGLSADGKTATLTFASASEVEVSSKVLEVEGIETAEDTLVKTAVFTQVFSYEDKVKPEIVSLESVTASATAGSLTITASEPIAAGSTLKIDGVNYAVNFNGTNTATVTGLSLDAAKAHTVELLNLSDKATTANVTAYTTKSFNVTVDATVPTATVSAQGDHHILVTFSKSMDDTSVTTALVNGVVKSESLGAVASNTAVAVPGSNNTKYVIEVTDTLYATTDSRTLHVVLPTGMTDKLGNKLVASTKSVTLTKDTTKPVATEFSVVKNAAGEVTDIVVNFNEGLDAAVQGGLANPTIIQDNGVLVTSFLGGLTNDAVTAGDKKVTYSVTTPAKVYGAYEFSFGAGLVDDQAETANSSAAFQYNYNFGTQPSGTGKFDLASAASTSASSNVIVVDYGTAVVGGNVANSATALSTYTLNGKALPAGTTITLNGAKQIATITLPADSIATTDGTAVFTVTGVKSLTGDTLNQHIGTVQVADNTSPVLKSADSFGNNIVLTFSEALGATAADATIAEVLANYKITSGTDTVVEGNGAATATLVSGNDKQVQITFSDVTDTKFDSSKTIAVETLSAGDLTDANNIAVKALVKVTAE